MCECVRVCTPCRLAPGHAYTSLLVTPLPCSSTSSTSSIPAGPSASTAIGGERLASAAGIATAAAASGSQPKQFIVLGSHVVLEAGHPAAGGSSSGGCSSGQGHAGPGGAAATALGGSAAAGAASPDASAGGRGVALQQVQGLLSVFEVVVQHTQGTVGAQGGPWSEGPGVEGSVALQAAGEGAAAAGGLELQYSLLLHGTRALDSVALCLAAAAPVTVHATEAGAADVGGSGSGGAVDAEGEGAGGGMAGAGHFVPIVGSTAAQAQAAAADLHLLVGGHDGVRAYAVHVDDGHGGRVGGAAVSAEDECAEVWVCMAYHIIECLWCNVCLGPLGAPHLRVCVSNHVGAPKGCVAKAYAAAAVERI